MSLELFIARRIYSTNDGERSVSRPVIRIALLGICIGLAVMIISICVALGFQNEVSSKVIGFGTHIQVQSRTQDQHRQLMPVITSDSLENVIASVPGVSHVQRFATKVGMLKTDGDFLGIQFKGVGDDYDTEFFRKNLVDGEMPHFTGSQSSGEIVISRRIASDLHLAVGSKVFAYFVGDESMRARRFLVKGIYETHLTRFDRNTVLTDIHTVRKLNNWDDSRSSGFEVTLADFGRLDEVTGVLVDKINPNPDCDGCYYGVFNIKELVPEIFSWLGVLDMNVVMIIVLMICVSVFTVISGLLIIMLERINMIGMLKAMGATDFSVRKIFMHFSIMLVGKGMLWGNLIGLLCCFLQDRLGLVRLDASVYYIESVPIRFGYLHIIAVNAITLCVSALVILGSSFLIGISKPAKTIRFE